MNMEIERRYLIRRPDEAVLAARPGCAYTDISQTYLRAAEGTTERVRRRGQDGQWRYSHTIKRRVSLMSHIEDECEISPDEYARLLRRSGATRFRGKGTCSKSTCIPSGSIRRSWRSS